MTETIERCPTCGNSAAEPKESRIGLNEFDSCQDAFHDSPRVLTAEDIERIGKKATKNGTNISYPKRY